MGTAPAQPVPLFQVQPGGPPALPEEEAAWPDPAEQLPIESLPKGSLGAEQVWDEQQQRWTWRELTEEEREAGARYIGPARPWSLWRSAKGLFRNLFIPILGSTQAQMDEDARRFLQVHPEDTDKFFDKKGNLTTKGANAWRSAMRGIDQLQMTAYGVGMLSADLVGLKVLADRMYEGVKQQMEEIEENAPEVPSLKSISEGYESGFRDVGPRTRRLAVYGSQAFFENVPTMLMTMGVGGLAGLAVKKILKRQLSKRIVEEALSRVAIKKAQEAAAKKVMLAQTGGVVAAATFQEAGSIYADMANDGIRGPVPALVAAAAALPAGFLEGITPLLLIRRVGNEPIKSPIEALVRSTLGEAIMEKGIVKMGVGGFEAAMSEGVTEYLQTAIEIAARLSQDPDVQGRFWEAFLQGYDVREELKEGFAKGFFAGGGMGMGAGVIQSYVDKVSGEAEKRALRLGAQHAIANANKPRMQPITLRKSDGGTMTIFVPVNPSPTAQPQLMPAVPGVRGADVVNQAIGMGLPATAEALNRPRFFTRGQPIPGIDIQAGAQIAPEFTPRPMTATEWAARQAAPEVSPAAQAEPVPPVAQPTPAEEAEARAAREAAGIPAEPTEQALGVQSYIQRDYPDLQNWRVVNSPADFPAEVLQDLREQGMKPENMDAVYYNGQVIFNAANFPLGDPALVRQKVFHESATHLGLRRTLGEARFKRLSKQIYRSLNDSERAQVAIQNNLDITDPEVVGEEWLAYEAERILGLDVPDSLWGRIADSVRSALRALRIPVRFNDRELARILSRGFEAARGRPGRRLYATTPATRASAVSEYGPGSPLAPVSEIRYSVADVRRATLEGVREYTPEVKGSELENAFTAVKNILYIEAETLSDLIPPETSWWQPTEGMSLIEYVRRFYSPEGIDLLRETFSRDTPPGFIRTKKGKQTWKMIKAELNEVDKGMASPNSGFGATFLAMNRKTGGVSWDFGLGTCMPTENCIVCYAKGLSDPTAGSKARVRHSIVTALQPEAVGELVARYIRNRPKADQAFLRVNGAGDTTFPWQAIAVNTAIRNMDRPVHIFSRSHVSRAPGTVGLDSIINGQYDPNDIENGVVVYKMGSIDRQLVTEYIDKYGIDFLKNNLRDRGIINSYLVKDVDDIPILQDLKRQGVFMVLHINKKNSLVKALHDAGILASAENPEMVTPSCYCALESGPFYNGCATCLLGGGPCFAMGTAIGMTPQGQFFYLPDLYDGAIEPPSEQLVEMSRIGVREDREQALLDAAARSYAMAASNLQGSVAQWKRGDLQRVKVENPRSRELLYYASTQEEIDQVTQLIADWRAFAKTLKNYTKQWKSLSGDERYKVRRQMKKALTMDQAVTEGIAEAKRAVEAAKPKYSMRPNEPDPGTMAYPEEGPPANTPGSVKVAPPNNPLITVPEHDREYLLRYSISWMGKDPLDVLEPKPFSNEGMEQAMRELKLNTTIEEAIGKPDAELMANVQRRMDRDPTWARSIIERERRRPGFLDDEETMALDLVALQVRHRVHYHSKRADDLIEAGKPDEAWGDRATADSYAAALEELKNISRQSGTLAGRAFRARQLAARWDFTVDTLFYEKRRASQWESLSREERAKLWQEMERKARKYDELTAQIQAQEAEQRQVEVDQKVDQARRDAEDINPEVIAYAKEWVAKYVRRADNAVDRIKNKWSRFFPTTPLRASVSGAPAGLPSELLTDLAIVGGSKIAANITNRTAWEQAMIEEIGQGITPYFEQIWQASQEHFQQELNNARAEMKARRAPRTAGEPDIAADILATKSKIHQIAENQKNSSEPAAPIADEIYYPVQTLIRQLVEQDPFITRDELIAEVHKVLLEDFPQWTELETMDAISGRGRWRKPSQEDAAKKIRDLKAQIRTLAHIEDIKAERPLPKTGFLQDEPSEEQRQLLRDLANAKREFGEVTTDDETNLKTYLDSRKKFYRNRIADLRWEIDKNRRIPRKERTKTTDEELEDLKAEFRRTREEHDAIFGNPEMTPEQQLARAEKAAERQILRLERDLAEGRRTYAGKRSPVQSARLEALRARIIQLKAEQEWAQMQLQPPPDLTKPADYRRWFQLDKQIRALEDQLATGKLFPKSKKIRPEDTPTNKRLAARVEELKAERKAMRERLGPGKPDPVAKAIKAKTAQLRRQIADYQQRLANREFEPRQKKVPDPAVLADPEVVRLTAERDRVVMDFAEELRKDRWRKKTNLQKIWHGIRVTRTAVTNLRSSFDYSALRQGLPAMISLATRIPQQPIRMPIKIAKIFGKMIWASLNKKAAERYNATIKQKPNWISGAYKVMDLQFTDIEAPSFTRAEENAKSVFDTWANMPLLNFKTPGAVLGFPIRALSRPIAGSNRAFATFLNLTRSELADALLEANFKDRPPTQLELQILGNWVNIATGRGRMNPKTASVASNFLWAPKLLASRVQFLVGQPLWGVGKFKNSGRARGIIALEYARVLTTGYLLYMISRMFDEKKEDDLRGTDYGKIVRGNTRIDIWGGMQQPVVFAARFLTGKTKSLSGRIRDVGAAREYGAPDRLQLLIRFLRSKAAPDVGVYLDLIAGSDFIGNPVTAKGIAEDLLIPLPFADLVQTMKDRGLTETMILQALNQFGMGVNTYDPVAPTVYQYTPSETRSVR
jgi:hypothetical protein